MVNQFVFNRGQFTQTVLPTLLVIGPLDPVHDRCAQLRPRHPSVPVEDILASSQLSVECGSEAAGVEESSTDVVGEIPEPESGPAQVLNPAVNGL